MPPVTVAKSCEDTAVRARKSQKAFSGGEVAGASFKTRRIRGKRNAGLPEYFLATEEGSAYTGEGGNDEKRHLGEKRGTLIFIPATSVGRGSCGRTARGLICYP